MTKVSIGTSLGFTLDLDCEMLARGFKNTSSRVVVDWFDRLPESEDRMGVSSLIRSSRYCLKGAREA